MAPEEVGVGGRGPAPALVLDEAVVRAQVHGHIRAVHRAFGDQAGRDPHQEFPVLRNLKDSFPVFDKPLGLKCLHDPVLIVPGDAEGGVDALEKAVVSLGIKKSLFVKAGSLELVVHVGGDDKIVFIADQVQKLPVDRFRRIQIAVDVDISGPESPGDLRFQAHHIEAARIHVVEAVFFFEIKEIFFESLPAVGKSRRGGEAGAGSDDDRVGIADFFFQESELSGRHSAAQGPDCSHPAADGLLVSVGQIAAWIFTIRALHKWNDLLP